MLYSSFKLHIVIRQLIVLNGGGVAQLVERHGASNRCFNLFVFQ